MDNVLNQLAQLFPMVNSYFMTGFLVFCRLLGFFRFAPIFCRKEIPGLVKIPIAILITVLMVPLMNTSEVLAKTDSFILSILLNVVVGAIIGYMARLIVIAVDCGAEMINMQMGLTSATTLDPTTSGQVSILTNVISLMGLLLFIDVGGFYWLFKAIMKSFEVFPVYAVHIPLAKIANMSLLTKLSSNTLYMGLQIASPVLLATMAQDIILGVISRTAPQVNVFQLSFLFKPVLGAAIMVWILPMLMNVIEQYFISFANII
ncbi:MAG: flagellar biosynthetic protein FliR [Cyanobacteriota bacterium]|nr:flagellar biosynthetic protein FliR [Cyanobacteriota bacterium]MDY6359378.1 flagellar biosynthetic protein FliR [Cyanobacteriota bacterium]MDY6364915.1 flagellar biosynthetic protein FliR [Cyanobacteriota bacterium]MDY6382856.1 flagellar biosynthetic protein FliR [Cyanobacteriota bacterium]